MVKNTKVISLSVEPDVDKKFSKEAKKRGITKSELFRRVMQMLPIDRNDVQLVVLQIPKDTMGDKQELEKWLRDKSQALVNKVFPS